jgi:hypothetical protein
MGVGIPNFKNIFKQSGEFTKQLRDSDLEDAYATFAEKIASGGLGDLNQYYGMADTTAKDTVANYYGGAEAGEWQGTTWVPYSGYTAENFDRPTDNRNNVTNTGNNVTNTGNGGQFNTGSGWTPTDWNAYADVRGDNYIQDDYSQGYRNVLDDAAQGITNAWDIYNQGAGGTDLTALEEAAANAASAEGSAFEAITNQEGFNTPTDLTSQIDTAYDTLAASAETQLGGLETKDFTPEIRELIESGRLDLRNLNAEQLGVLNDAFTRRTGQISGIQGELEGQLQQQEGFRQSVQQEIADTTATRAGQMTADQQARVDEARAALGGQVTSSFEDAALLAGGLTGSQAMSSTAGMDRLAQVANQGAAARLAAPALLAAEAQLAVGDEKFRLENQLSLALTESLAELGAQERAQVLQEAMRQEEFGVARDQALANALVNIAGQRTGATLGEAQRLEDISQRQGEITQAQGFATAQQQETQRFQQEQQRLAMEFQNANNEIDRQMARDQMAQNERQFNMKIAQQEADRAIDTAAYEADLNLRTDEAKEAAYQSDQAYQLALAEAGASEDAEIAAAEAAAAQLLSNVTTMAGLATEVLGLQYTPEDLMAMTEQQRMDISRRIVDKQVEAHEANAWEVGSSDWLVHAKKFSPAVAADAVQFGEWANELARITAIAQARGGVQPELDDSGRWLEGIVTSEDLNKYKAYTSAMSKYVADNMSQATTYGDPSPTPHLTNVNAAYRASSEARQADMGWVGTTPEDVLAGGSSQVWGPTGTFTNIWESPFASAGSAIGQREPINQQDDTRDPRYR